jgi:hypothetical protein
MDKTELDLAKLFAGILRDSCNSFRSKITDEGPYKEMIEMPGVGVMLDSVFEASFVHGAAVVASFLTEILDKGEKPTPETQVIRIVKAGCQTALADFKEAAGDRIATLHVELEEEKAKLEAQRAEYIKMRDDLIAEMVSRTMKGGEA